LIGELPLPPEERPQCVEFKPFEERLKEKHEYLEPLVNHEVLVVTRIWFLI